MRHICPTCGNVALRYEGGEWDDLDRMICVACVLDEDREERDLYTGSIVSTPEATL